MILLTAFIFTVALIHEASSVKQYFRPCENKSASNAYTVFAERHILNECFNRCSPKEWERYLKAKGKGKDKGKGLWCRVPLQSFIESSENVKQICKSEGRRLLNNQNQDVTTSVTSVGKPYATYSRLFDPPMLPAIRSAFVQI